MIRAAVPKNTLYLCYCMYKYFKNILVNTIRTEAQRFREDFIVKLISKMKMFQQKNKEQSLTIMRQQQSIRQN